MTISQEIALWIIATCLVIQTALHVKTQFTMKKSLRRFNEIQNTEHKAIKAKIASRDYNEALKLVASLKKSKPGDPYAWYYAGQCYYHMKDWANAREQLQEAQRMNPFWEKEWTGPYLLAIELQASRSKPV